MLNQAMSILLLPLYTRFLTPADYGVLEVIYFLSSIVAIVLGLGIADAMNRFYFDSEEQARRNLVVSTTTIGIGGIYLGFCLLLLPFSGLAANLFLDSPNYTDHFVILFLTLGVGFTNGIGMSYLRVEKRSVTLMIYSVSQLLLTIALNLYFIIELKMGAKGILLSTLIANSIMGFGLLAWILRRTGLHFSREIYKEMIAFGLPMIPSSLGSYVVIASDRYFVKEYVSLADTGLYSLGYKIGAAMHSFVTSPFIQIWTPRRFELFGTEDSEQVFAKIYTYFFAVLTFLGLAVSLLAKDILKIMTTDAYWSAFRIVPVIVLAHLIHALYYHFTIAISYKKQTKYYAYLNITVGVINLALNFALIPTLGVMGAALSTLITYTARSGLVYYYADRLHPITFEFTRTIKLLLAAGAVFWVGQMLASGSLWTDVAIQSGVLLLFPALLFILGFMTPTELSFLKARWQQYSAKIRPTQNFENDLKG
jgi:O-antigen/teichoic acid export membrane protein